MNLDHHVDVEGDQCKEDDDLEVPATSPSHFVLLDHYLLNLLSIFYFCLSLDGQACVARRMRICGSWS